MFKKIYLFSGIENYGDDKEKEKYKENIEIIKKQDLWKFLKNNISYFNKLQDNYYYKIETDTDNKDNEISICDLEKYGWALHKHKEKWTYKEGKVRKKFRLYFYDNKNIEENNKILKNQIQWIDFNYNCFDKNMPNFRYNCEFKCFIIENAKKEEEKNEIKNIIEEVKPIIKLLK